MCHVPRWCQENISRIKVYYNELFIVVTLILLVSVNLILVFSFQDHAQLNWQCCFDINLTTYCV